MLSVPVLFLGQGLWSQVPFLFPELALLPEHSAAAFAVVHKEASRDQVGNTAADGGCNSAHMPLVQAPEPKEAAYTSVHDRAAAYNQDSTDSTSLATLAGAEIEQPEVQTSAQQVEQPARSSQFEDVEDNCNARAADRKRMLAEAPACSFQGHAADSRTAPEVSQQAADAVPGHLQTVWDAGTHKMETVQRRVLELEEDPSPEHTPAKITLSIPSLYKSALPGVAAW